MTLAKHLYPLLFLWIFSAQGASAAQNDAPPPGPGFSISYATVDLDETPQPAAATEDLWARMRTGFGLASADPLLTSRHEQWFAGRSGFLEQAITRSQLYLFHIVEQVEKRGMPMEIALLPMIESAYNPQAVSSQKASGIWQFMPSTGRLYGLEQNSWYDGRKDVLAATSAALDYLQKLHGIFGDWQLALAAYNCGDGCVRRAQQRNTARGLPTDYASLDLPAETRNYVPKLLAVRNIISDPDRYGVSLASLPNQPYFTQIRLKAPMEAKVAAKMAGMDIEAFRALNPGFHRRVIYTDTADVVLLPTDKVAQFKKNLAETDDSARLQSYRAMRGELATQIASRFGVTLQWLKDHNPLALHRGKLASTQTLVVPAGTTQVSLATTRSPSVASISAPAKRAQASVETRRVAKRTHRIRKGDTLSRVARRYNVSVSEIRRVNQAMAEPLQPGKILAIPQSNS